jgi:para-aminobenzoate synthetase component 1
VLFLDSAAKEPMRGRYSYITASPFEVISVNAGEARVSRPVTADLFERRYETVLSRRPSVAVDPFRLVADRLQPWAATEEAGMPPFQGGAAGLFGYGLSRWTERLPLPARDEFQTADLVLGLYDWVLAFDHDAGTCHCVSQGFPEHGDRDRAERAAQRTEQILEILARKPGPTALPKPASTTQSRKQVSPTWPVEGPAGLRSNFSREAYVRAVERAIEYIHAGDIFQVNLSQRLVFPQKSSPVALYERLRRRNAAPFAGYFDVGDAVIASSSPEQFLSLSEGEVVTRPIKGTRPREYTPEADSYGREALRESEKDQAENVMIVDLLRNDLSRVSKPHTVTVPRLFEMERHPTVHHLVSEVRGQLREGLGALDLLRATFPGGSITGAPKVRAMEIIAELEPTARGPYCGSMGWIAFHGGMNLNILIRTVTIAGGWLQFPVGGGIVAMSHPGVEYQETLDKAGGILRALE